MAEITTADPDKAAALADAPPPFFSAQYHFDFLPRVIHLRLDEYRRRQREARSGFGPHVQIEIPLLLFACLLLVVLGLPAALQRGSIGGWVSTLIGAGAFAALMGWSIYSEWRWRREERQSYGYAVFMPSVFFFCVLAGGSAGLIAGGVVAEAPAVGCFWALPGLLAGYLVGPFAARWVHALGFMKTWFIYLAILGLILLPLEDLMVLYIYAGKS